MTKKRKNSSTVDVRSARSETGQLTKKDAERILDLLTNARYSNRLRDKESLRTAQEFYPEAVEHDYVRKEFLYLRKYIEVYCTFLENEVKYLETQNEEIYKLYRAMGKVYEN